MHSRDTQYLKFETRFLNIYNCVYKTPFRKFGHISTINIQGQSIYQQSIYSKQDNIPSSGKFSSLNFCGWPNPQKFITQNYFNMNN